MVYFINRDCACGGGSCKEITEAEFEAEVAEDLGGVISVEGEKTSITYHVHSCKTCRAEQDEAEAQEEELKNVPNVCGYCGSTKPLVSCEEMYGPGAVGWPCCPDCGGV